MKTFKEQIEILKRGAVEVTPEEEFICKIKKSILPTLKD